VKKVNKALAHKGGKKFPALQSKTVTGKGSQSTSTVGGLGAGQAGGAVLAKPFCL